MKNLKKRSVMGNNIELFDRYIDGKLDPEENLSLEQRLSCEKDFALDFRIYLLSIRGIYQETEQDNIEFGQAMKNISKEELLRIIGSTSRPKVLRLNQLRERIAWIASIAAVLIIGIFSVINVRQSDMDKLDNIIVAYNYIPDSNRGWETIAPKDIPSLEKAYQTASPKDIQAQQDAGMRLAMAYLKVHDREKAKDTLTGLTIRFADDEEFVAQCQKILNQLK